MTFREIFCPNCGQKTRVNDEKPVCFCLKCGYKIQLQATPRPAQTVSVTPNTQADNQATAVPRRDSKIVDEKLKEVAFYYDLSQEKDEAECDEPVYYLKAQDLLVDLSQQFPNDYRIWWELCKPVDFYRADSSSDVHDQYRINGTHFEKALTLAGLDMKRQLIDAYDQYTAAKKKVQVQYAQEQERLAQEEQRKQQEAERKRQEEENQRRLEQERLAREEQRKQQEAERKRQKEENQRRLEQERLQKLQEEQAAEVRIREEKLRAQRLNESTGIWELLAKKDYSILDGSYFKFSAGNRQEVIGAFRMVSNVLYLMAFRVDDSKKNQVLYREQTIAVEFNHQGTAIKYDKRPVIISGFLPPNNTLCVTLGLESGYSVCDLQLQKNPDYITRIIKNAKKPLLPTKFFL